jgi:hypothetical protein
MDPQDIYYEVQFELGENYLYRDFDHIDPFDDLSCICGEDLMMDDDPDVDIFYCCRLRVTCQKCSRAFDPSTRYAIVRNGRTDQERSVAGGVTSRFAVCIDCGMSC